MIDDYFKSLAHKLEFVFLIFALYYVLLLGYLPLLLVLAFGKMIGVTDETFWSFTKAWFRGEVIP